MPGDWELLICKPKNAELWCVLNGLAIFSFGLPCLSYQINEICVFHLMRTYSTINIVFFHQFTVARNKHWAKSLSNVGKSVSQKQVLIQPSASNWHSNYLNLWNELVIIDSYIAFWCWEIRFFKFVDSFCCFDISSLRQCEMYSIRQTDCKIKSYI